MNIAIIYLLVGVFSVFLDFNMKKGNIVNAPLYVKSKDHFFPNVILAIIVWPMFRVWLIVPLIIIIFIIS